MIEILPVKKSVLVFLPATDFNEEEYLIIKSGLEKAGLKIFIASDSNSLCAGSGGLKVKNDVKLYNLHESNFGGLVLIGGSGVRSYWNNTILHSVAKKFAANRKPVAAICSAPVLLARAGVLNSKATCYPDDKKELEREGIEFIDAPVYSDKNIITAQGPFAAQELVKSFVYELTRNLN
jgi:protease I